MGEVGKITVKAATKILKYAPGADPEKDEPFEVVEREVVLEGEEAETIIQQLVGDEKHALD